jgi:filamentous hemagglutinin
MDPLAPEFTHTLVRKAMQAIAGMDRVTRPGGIATDEGLSAAVRAGMQHLAAHKGDVRAALAAAKAAGARWTDSVAEVAIPANAEAAKPGMHREPATSPDQPHSLAERPGEPRAVWHGVVPISPRHPTEPITRFVSHYPLAELAILGTESVGFGSKNAVTAVGAGAAIEPAEDAAEVAPNKAAEGDAENAARRNRSIPPLPDKNAEGRPHSTVQRPGARGRYTTYDEHGPIKQYRGEPGPGEPHGQPRPNVKEWPRNVAPDSRTYPGTPRVRQPTPDEIPGEPPVAPGPQIGPEESPEIEFPF